MVLASPPGEVDASPRVSGEGARIANNRPHPRADMNVAARPLPVSGWRRCRQPRERLLGKLRRPSVGDFCLGLADSGAGCGRFRDADLSRGGTSPRGEDRSCC